jgi:hypothetical protein
MLKHKSSISVGISASGINAPRNFEMFNEANALAGFNFGNRLDIHQLSAPWAIAKKESIVFVLLW